MDDAQAAVERGGIRGETFELRPEDFKLLSSDTRVQILKLLDERAMTGTELGKRLDLEKSTVHQHLERLVEGGFVQRREDDRLWVYYELSPRGRRLLHPPRAGFTLLLSGSLLSAGASVALAATWLLGNAVQAPQRMGESSPVTDEASDGASAPKDSSGAPDTSVSDGAAAPSAAAEDAPFPLLAGLAVGMFLLAGLLAGAAWVARPR